MIADNWKSALSTYINQHNKSEVNYRPQAEPSNVTDLNYLIQSGERRLRLDKWYQQRGATPLRNETRARIVREVATREGEREVEILLHYLTDYEKAGVPHREERVDRQYVMLQQEEGHWLITQVKPIVLERHPVELHEAPISNEHLSRTSVESGPFLNQDILKGGGVRGYVYQRSQAAAYADLWWNANNPEFAAFDVDCTNFVSQGLFAGGAPINYTGKRESGWWYKGYIGGKESWSYSWAVSNSLKRLLTQSRSGLKATAVERAEQLELGDVILYDWDGNGRYQHSTIVTAFDAGGMPLVNAHTNNSKHRYWDYQNSYAWSENTVYRFFHIADRF